MMTSRDSAWVTAPGEARIEVIIRQRARLTHDRRRALPELAHALAEREEVVGYLDRRDATAEACAIYLVGGGVAADSS